MKIALYATLLIIISVSQAHAAEYSCFQEGSNEVGVGLSGLPLHETVYATVYGNFSRDELPVRSFICGSDGDCTVTQSDGRETGRTDANLEIVKNQSDAAKEKDPMRIGGVEIHLTLSVPRTQAIPEPIIYKCNIFK